MKAINARKNMKNVLNTVADGAPGPESDVAPDATKTILVAAGGILGAVAASACCVVPLLLFSLGVSGAWIGQLTALSPYQPIFLTIAVGFLGYGYWLVYYKPKTACSPGDVCARPLPGAFVKISLWLSTALVSLAFAWPYIVPIILK